MPAVPPTALPFGPMGQTLKNTTQYWLGLLSNFLSSNNQPTTALNSPINQHQSNKSKHNSRSQSPVSFQKHNMTIEVNSASSSSSSSSSSSYQPQPSPSASSPSPLPSHTMACLDVGILPFSAHEDLASYSYTQLSTEAASPADAQRAILGATEHVASAIKPLLIRLRANHNNNSSNMQMPLPRILLLGSHASSRAVRLCQLLGFSPAHVNKLHLPITPQVDDEKSSVSSGIFWSEDLSFLPQVAADTFDVLVCFNTHWSSSLINSPQQVFTEFKRILKAGGILAGTGCFQAYDMMVEMEKQFTNTSLDSSSSSPSVTSSLRAFRDYVECQGFYVHSCSDLSLEGQVIFQLLTQDDMTHLNPSPQELALLQTLQKSFSEGKVQCGKFVATKQLETNTQTTVTSPKSTELSHSSSSSSLAVLPTSDSFSETVVPTLRHSASLSSLSTFHNDPNVFPSSKCSSPDDSPSHSPLLSPSPSSALLPSLPSLTTTNTSLSDTVVVSGVSLGLPNSIDPDRAIFDKQNIQRLFNGENMIDSLTVEEKQSIIDMNPCMLTKKDGKRVKIPLCEDKQMIQVCSKFSSHSIAQLAQQYSLPSHVTEVLDITYQLAVCAGLEALHDAGFVLNLDKAASGDVSEIGLPEHQRDETGVIFASSFPCMESTVEEVTKAVTARVKKELAAQMEQRTQDDTSESSNQVSTEVQYEYDRKLLFKLLVMANCQLAELIHARGPNSHINTACSGQATAIAIAEDWIRTGRCKRVVVISADAATSPNLMPYLGTGFLGLGAATILSPPTEASAPFDVRRKGMILGAGAVGVVLETAAACLSRGLQPKAEVVGSHFANSAHHPTAMDSVSIGHHLSVFLNRLETQGILSEYELSELPLHCIYFAHETGTYANGGCAKVEMDALAHVFADKKKHMLITNTKGFTGHPMAVGFEDVMAVESLVRGIIPPVANHRNTDPKLGLEADQISKGGAHDRNYVLRFAAGFGSQFVYVLYKKWDPRT